MRIQQAESISGSHIRDDHIIDKGWFSSTGFPYNIDVSKFIFFTNSKSDFLPSIVGISDQSKLSFRGVFRSRNKGWVREFPIYGIFQSFDKIILCRKMEKVDYLRKIHWRPDGFLFLFPASLCQKRSKNWSQGRSYAFFYIRIISLDLPPHIHKQIDFYLLFFRIFFLFFATISHIRDYFLGSIEKLGQIILLDLEGIFKTDLQNWILVHVLKYSKDFIHRI